MGIKITGNEVNMVQRPGVCLDIRATGTERCKACGRLLLEHPERHAGVVHREFLRTCRHCAADQGLQEHVHVS